MGREQEIMQGALTGQVAGVMDMMKGLRVSLSTKLSESQSLCQALAQELAAQKAKNAAFERCCSYLMFGSFAPATWEQVTGLCWQQQHENMKMMSHTVYIRPVAYQAKNKTNS